MDTTSSATLEEVKTVLVTILGIEDRASTLNSATLLFGSMPEFDSMAVVELVVALEQRFGITIGEDEVTGEVFESLGSLATFVDEKIA